MLIKYPIVQEIAVMHVFRQIQLEAHFLRRNVLTAATFSFFESVWWYSAGNDSAGKWDNNRY